MAESLAQARLNLSSLVGKARQIILHLEAGSSAILEKAEKELIIRVKHKCAGCGLYSVTAETLPVVAPEPTVDHDLSDNISSILQEFRANSYAL